MQSALEFGKFLDTSTWTGKVKLVVKFTAIEGKIEEFLTAFQPTIDISVKEQGCQKVI